MDHIAEQDLARRRPRYASDVLRTDTEPIPGTTADARTGFMVKLTGKQVTTVLALAGLLAGGAVKYFTSVPDAAKAQHAVAVEAPAEPKAEALALHLKAHVDDVSGLRDDLRDTREQLSDLRKDIRELRRALREVERQGGLRRNAGTLGEGGGSK
jgi:hypothetical protein